MGATGPLLPALPVAETARIDRVLNIWEFDCPSLYARARLLIAQVERSVRHLIDAPGDGIGVRFQATGFGLVVEGVYGWFCCIERLILAKIGSPTPDAPEFGWWSLGYVAFNPDGATFDELPWRLPPDTLNVLAPDFGYDVDVAFVCLIGTTAESPAIATGLEYFGIPDADSSATRRSLCETAPPWLPRIYLRDHVPRSVTAFGLHLPVDNAGAQRNHQPPIKEQNMRSNTKLIVAMTMLDFTHRRSMSISKRRAHSAKQIPVSRFEPSGFAAHWITTTTNDGPRSSRVPIGNAAMREEIGQVLGDDGVRRALERRANRGGSGTGNDSAPEAVPWPLIARRAESPGAAGHTVQ